MSEPATADLETRSMRILVVDDEPLNVALLEGLLGDEGFTKVRGTTDSRLALPLYCEMKPDLVLLDLMMPHFDGFAVMRQLAEQRGPEEFVPVMVLTADVTESAKKRALAAGATDFLIKPFDRTEAVLRITNLLRTRRVHVALAAQNEILEQKVSDRTAALQATLEELRATQQQVVQKERLSALGAMVTGIAHDFNNSLALILGYGELLQQECRRIGTSSSMTDYAQTIISASLDAAETVNRMREFHRPLEADETRAPVLLGELIEQAITFTRPRWESQSRARGFPIEVQTEFAATSPISGHPAELREMLTNLIFNAVDAMPQGGTITLSTREDAAGGEVVLQVADTGTGMSEETRRRCLEPFFTTKGERGSGLGLAMVYGTVERHGGSLEIESSLGRGTRFIFRFPAAAAGVAVPEQMPGEATRPLRILVVDDQPVLCEVIAESFARDWHTVVTACNGREALQKFEAEHFDIVVTDKAMPELNGDQLAAAVKARSPATGVIMLTGFTEAAELDGDSEFIDAVLTKPATTAELREVIGKVMRRPCR
jgi:signal transduction histidine kinase